MRVHLERAMSFIYYRRGLTDGCRINARVRNELHCACMSFVTIVGTDNFTCLAWITGIESLFKVLGASENLVRIVDVGGVHATFEEARDELTAMEIRCLG
jgi:hypothetical protein